MLSERHSGAHVRRQLFAAGCILGALAFLLIYGFTPLDVTSDFWLRGGFVEKDIQQHYAGWLFYRDSPLSLPLGLAQGINWPAGISVLYTDSIPLFAVLFRLLAGILPPVFQYFGIYTLLCFMLQGGFAALLLSLFFHRPATVLLGSIPLVFSPVLIERAFRHTSLAAHFLILAALFYYVLSHRENRFAFKGLFALNILTITLHPYLVPMTYAITFAMLLEYAVRNHQWAKPAAYLGGDLLATVAAGWLFGLFTGTAEGGSIVEYGFFGMNLNALWNPTSCGDTVWSAVLPVQNQVRGNYDSFAYLGLGMLICLAAVLVCIFVFRQWKQVLGWVRRHWALALVCAILTLFAITHMVTANGATLFTLPLPHALVRLCTTFRASGRMFWPVYYLLMLMCILFCGRVLRGRRALLLLGLLAAVQLADLSPALVQRHRMFSEYVAPFPSELTSDFWQQAAGQYEHIVSLDELQYDPLHLALYAVDNGMTTNDPFAARFDETALAQQRQEDIAQLESGSYAPDCLYLIQNEGLFLRLADALPQEEVYCGRLDEHWYVLAPDMEYGGEDAVPFGEDFLLRLPAFNDDNWLNGVLFRAPTEEWTDKANRTILLPDCPYTRRLLENASAIRSNGTSYPILIVDDRDAGWLMVTLEIEDAAILVDQDLEVIQ